MNYSISFICVILLFAACEPPKKDTVILNEQKPSEQIDDAVEDAKVLLDLFGKKAKDFLESDEIDKIKDLADEVKGKGEEMLKDTAVWKAKLEELKEDKEIKELIEKYKNESEDIFKNIEDILEALEDDVKKK